MSEWRFALWFFLAAAGCGYVMLPQIRKLHLGQEVRDDGPKSHYQKSGTPTFGGLFFLIPLAVYAIYRLCTEGLDAYSQVVLLMLVFGGVGFADDYIKVRVDKGGLSVKQKVFWLGLASALFSWKTVYRSPELVIYRHWRGGEAVSFTGAGQFFIALVVMLYLFYVANSVNIADGVDGLSSTLVAITMFFYVLLTSRLAGRGLAIEAAPLAELSFSIMGGVLGFLLYNHHPAKCFMGDTGSQALGAAVGAIPLLLGVPWAVLFAGLLFIVEGLSVLLQVGYFKATGGKRIFRMAPLHHHFELGGWKEAKVVSVFACFQILGGLLALWLV